MKETHHQLCTNPPLYGTTWHRHVKFERMILSLYTPTHCSRLKTISFGFLSGPAMSYLLSRGADPFLGIFTGLLAYYLHETHPRTARPQEERLVELLKWKYQDYQAKRQEAQATLESPAS